MQRVENTLQLRRPGELSVQVRELWLSSQALNARGACTSLEKVLPTFFPFPGEV